MGRFGNGRVLFGGVLLAALAYTLFLPVAPDWTYAAMLPTMLLPGLAFALAYGPLTMAATAGVDEPEQGLASGLLHTSIQFGTALGISTVTAVTVATAGEGSAGVELASIRSGLAVPVVAILLAAVVTALDVARHRRPAAPADAVSERPRIAA